MKLFIVISVVLAVALALPYDETKILSYENRNNGVDGYKFAFETGDGVHQEQQGSLQNPNSEDAYLSVVGEFSYPGDDGKTYKVQYTADQNGYHPTGEHLPH